MAEIFLVEKVNSRDSIPFLAKKGSNITFQNSILRTEFTFNRVTRPLVSTSEKAHQAVHPAERSKAYSWRDRASLPYIRTFWKFNLLLLFAYIHRHPWDYLTRYQFREIFVQNKVKAIPLQAWTGSEGSRRLRLPDFKTVVTWRW
jgi:hypothetical protein